MLILRYFQIKGNPTKINYNNVQPNWTGSIDVFNYQEKHLRTFNFEKGKLISYVRFSPPNTKQIGKN
ncbi:hypothetical protein EL17_02680 [Anditalea andensis]|uniref:Uncharacterized protein n=1 Tax=Anditalea andensis TaxID=1048983 RepID=A0A074LL90_9BACT|nr:hypothetical protein EL17_02680 [Anditalea andensis]